MSIECNRALTCHSVLSLLNFKEARVLSAGTMCSGSDSPIVWLQALSRAVYDNWRIVVLVEHSYAVEASTWKQLFLKDVPFPFKRSADLGIRGIAQVLWRFLVVILSTRIARCRFCNSRCIDEFLYINRASGPCCCYVLVCKCCEFDSSS